MADRSVMPAVAGSNVIPFPSRDREDTRVEFLLRFHAADILHAEYRLSEARCWAARSLGSEAAIQGARDEHWHIHEQLVAATARLAEFPVSTWGQLRLKKSAIGKIWLRAEGEPYASWRKFVEFDERRLEIESPKRRRFVRP